MTLFFLGREINLSSMYVHVFEIMTTCQNEMSSHDGVGPSSYRQKVVKLYWAQGRNGSLDRIGMVTVASLGQSAFGLSTRTKHII